MKLHETWLQTQTRKKYRATSRTVRLARPDPTDQPTKFFKVIRPCIPGSMAPILFCVRSKKKERHVGRSSKIVLWSKHNLKYSKT